MLLGWGGLGWGQRAGSQLWTTVFFRWKQIVVAFIFIIAIIILTIVTIILMKKISKKGAYLLIPYVLWLCFAGYLNGYIMFTNQKIILYNNILEYIINGA